MKLVFVENMTHHHQWLLYMRSELSNLSEWNDKRGHIECECAAFAFTAVLLSSSWMKSEWRERCSECRQMAAAGWSAAVLDVIGFTWVAGGTHFSGLMSEPLYTSHLRPHLLHALSIRLPDLRCSLSLHSHSCFFLPPLSFLFWPQTTNISCWRQHGSREGKHRTQQLRVFSKYNDVLFCLKEMFFFKKSLND